MSTALIVVLLLVAVAVATSPLAANIGSIYSPAGTSDFRRVQIAQAIANAEGYYVAGSLPQRLNNPGSLKLAENTLTQFATANEGWNALYRQIDVMLSGQSAYYTPYMSIREVAWIYTGGDNPDTWANSVAAWLGVSPDTQMRNV